MCSKHSSLLLQLLLWALDTSANQTLWSQVRHWDNKKHTVSGHMRKIQVQRCCYTQLGTFSSERKTWQSSTQGHRLLFPAVIKGAHFMLSNYCLSEADACKNSILHQSSSSSSTKEWLLWKLNQIMVLHRRRSKLSNVLCFLNTPNFPLPCSTQDVVGWRFLSLSPWDIALNIISFHAQSRGMEDRPLSLSHCPSRDGEMCPSVFSVCVTVTATQWERSDLLSLSFVSSLWTIWMEMLW